MKKPCVAALVLVAMALAAFAQEPAQEAPPEEPLLWMPEGYRLLSLEERSALPPDEMRAIGARNQELLREAISGMTPEDRQELAARLGALAQTSELKDYERQYVTIVSMMLVSATTQERVLADRAAEEERFAAFLKRQEETTKGFPSDQKSVEAEADAIEAELGKTESRTLYLRALRPLRARPWNDAIRVAFRKLVRGDSYPRAQKTSLYDAALVFAAARQRETPEEGAWYSLEAFLRLSMRGEADEARRLFAVATQKNARDVESRIFPILLAEADGDAREVERLMPRSQEAWRTREDLDRVLWDSIDVLPREMQPRVREAFGARYKKAHPADWGSRAAILAAELEKGRFREVEDETATLLALPAATLPEPDRSEFASLRIRAVAGEGRCDDALAALPRLEAEARAAHPGWDSADDPPAPRTEQDVRELRAQRKTAAAALAKLRAQIADGTVDLGPEGRSLSAEERRAGASGWADDLAAELERSDDLLRLEDAAAAAEWTRTELAAWRESRGMPQDAYFDGADRGTRLVIDSRGAVGSCLIARGRPADAVRVLAPCVGADAIFHSACGEPLLEAGGKLVEQGRYRDAGAAYAALAPVRNFAYRAEDIRRAIEKTAPGTVRPFEPSPTATPAVSPTPGPTPRLPPA